jgi:hypothetical protein
MPGGDVETGATAQEPDRRLCQLIRQTGFLQYDVGPDIQRPTLVRIVAVTAEANHRNCCEDVVTADPLHEFEAVHLRQRKIRDDQGRSSRAHQREGRLSVRGLRHLEHLPEELGVHHPSVGVILDQQKHRHGSGQSRLMVVIKKTTNGRLELRG